MTFLEHWLDHNTNLKCWGIYQEAGFWCGYVEIPLNHPWYPVEGEFELFHNLRVHGGITFSGFHEAIPAYIVGFDCGHLDDIKRHPIMPNLFKNATFKDLDFIKTECAELAKQIYNAPGYRTTVTKDVWAEGLK